MQEAAAAYFPRLIKSSACSSTDLNGGASTIRRRSYAPLALSCILLALVVTMLPYLALQSSLASCGDSINCARSFFRHFIFNRARSGAFGDDQYSFRSAQVSVFLNRARSGAFGDDQISFRSAQSDQGTHAKALAPAAAGMANRSLTEVLKAAVMQEGHVKNMVIITTVNEAWVGRTSGHEHRGSGGTNSSSSSSSMVDIFLESFRWGEGTEALLRHLVMVTLDERAFVRCLHIHPFGHCYRMPETMGIDFSGEKAFMSADYLAMVWRKVQLLTEVLEQGYSFVFTDADVLWLRNPFPHFLPDRDLQIGCDKFNGNPAGILQNKQNTGFMFFRANERTVRFCRHWFNARTSYPQHYHDQDVFNAIKSLSSIREIGLTLSLLDTQHFGGFCDVGKSDLGKVVTMHANCCKGLHAKITDLTAFLNGWKEYRDQQLVKGSSTNYTSTGLTDQRLHGSAALVIKTTPKECRRSMLASKASTTKL